MPIQIRKVTAETIKLNVLAYGLPGVGKTTFAAQAADHPDMSPVLFLNLEGGLLSVAGRGLDEVRISTIKDLDDVVKSLYAGELAQYKTIVVDSGSELAKLSLLEKTALGLDRDQRKGKGADRTLDDVQLENYGQSNQQMIRLFRALRDAPAHTVMTALSRTKYPQGTNADTSRPVAINPDFSAALSLAVTGMMDMVWYMYIDSKGRRSIQTQRSGIIEAKTRGARFAETVGLYVAEPALDELYATLLYTEAGIGELPERFIREDETEGQENGGADQDDTST